MPAAISTDMKIQSSAGHLPAWFSRDKASGTSPFFQCNDYFSYERVMVSLPLFPTHYPLVAHTNTCPLIILDRKSPKGNVVRWKGPLDGRIDQADSLLRL